MVALRAVGRTVLWLLCGVAGSLAILLVVNGVAEQRNYPRLQSGHVFTDFWDRGYVTAVGTWVFEDDTKQAFPRQTSEIKCYRETKECQSAQAEIAMEMLTVQTERFPIKSWDNESIVYVSSDPLCVVYTYTISRSTKRVSGKREPKASSSAEPSCASFEKRTFYLSLRDGFSVWQQLKAEDQKVLIPILYGSLGAWWAFVVYRIVRTMRRPALAKSYGSALMWAALLGLFTHGSADAAQVSLSCWGEVELMQQGKQVNPIGEKSSIALAVDIARKIITIDGVEWPIFGDASRETIVSLDPNKGSLTLNRTTGSISVHFIQLDGLKKFYGECKPAQKLF